MAYKVLASRDATIPTVFETKEALSDPRLNKLYPKDGVSITNEQYFKFARQLFSTENIRNNPTIFTTNGRCPAPIAGFNDKFLEKIPEELHELSFLLSYHYNTWDNYYADSRYVPAYDTYSACVYGNNMGGNQININNEAYWTSLIIYLATVKDFFNGSVWTAIKNQPVSYNTIVGDSTFRHAGMLMNGYRYVYRTAEPAGQPQDRLRGVQIGAEETAEILSEANAAVSFVYTEANGWTLHCPVSLRNKSSLYQVFSASQDVTAILGKGAPSKKKIVRKGKTIEVQKSVPKMYGVELELTTDKTAREMINLQGDPVFFLTKQDGSITGSKRNKLECVTMPMELVDHRRGWTRFFANVGEKNDFDVSTQTNNGMHVHISRSLFTDKHLKQFAWFITAPEHREFILLLSQRTQDAFDRWSPAPKFTQPSHFKAFTGVLSAVGNLRGAVNTGSTRNKPTVEVRIFKGIVSCAEVLRNLEVVDALYEFTRPVSEGGYSNYASLTIQNFYDWVKSTPKNQYKLLRADLWKLDIPNLIKKARTLRLLYNITDPETMVKKINAEADRTEKLKTNKFEIDKIVYATVTRVIGRRCLSVDKDGKLVVVQKAVGRIAHLDEKLLKNYDKQTKTAN